jgi:hypothetical protein
LRVWKPVRALQREQRRQQHAGARQQHERRAICVTANSRSGGWCRGDAHAAARRRARRRLGDGSRGTNASSTAAASASPTPTHSRLASTVRSSARTEKRDA